MSQPMEALALANEVRFARARMKKEIKSGEVDVCSLILDPPDELWSMPLIQLLKAKRGYGQVKSSKLCRRAQLEEHRPLGSLTTTQRRRLVALMGGWG